MSDFIRSPAKNTDASRTVCPEGVRTDHFAILLHNEFIG